MVLGDGIRRNIASVDPSERIALIAAFRELNNRNNPDMIYPGSRDDMPAPGGVTRWFKQDEIHQATHVHHGPEFLPWHRELVNHLEEMLRMINPQLSLHYWDWTQDPRAIPNANLGGGSTGTLDLFKSDFMGWGGPAPASIGEHWKEAGFYDPDAGTPNHPLDRDITFNPADTPRDVYRNVLGSPASKADDDAILGKVDYADMRNGFDGLESVHDAMHGFVNMGPQHLSFRDPFVFLLHSNVDRLFARWQTDPKDPDYPDRLEPSKVYGSESQNPGLNSNVEPWSTGHSNTLTAGEHFTRPWFSPENQGSPHTYKDLSIVTPPLYDTNYPKPKVYYSLRKALEVQGIPFPAKIRSVADGIGLLTPISVRNLIKKLA